MNKLINEDKEMTASIGVGSNMGNRYNNISAAENEINKSPFCKVTKISKIYETEPFGYLDQNYFLNCVFEIKTLLSPIKLLEFLLEIEKLLKRERIIHWGPRTIDLDILFYEKLVITSEKLVLPHPGISERLFVLKPLCDITPFFIHPVLNVECNVLLEKLQTTQKSLEEWLPSENINPKIPAET